MSSKTHTLTTGLLAAGLIVVLSLTSQAIHHCPICQGQKPLSEEIEEMDVVAILKLVYVPPVDPRQVELAKAKFEIVEVLKGKDQLRPGEKIELIYFGDGKPGSTFLSMGIDPPPKRLWSTPVPLTPRSVEYLKQLPALPKNELARLPFYQKYLEDQDDLVANDAFNEFAKASYANIKAMKGQLNHDQIVKWIQATDIPANRRRLYLMMLGACGNENDLPMLEAAMKSTDRKAKSGLDAVIACYLTLRGDAGMPLVEELFFTNKKFDYADTYAAITALRFHGNDGTVLKRERVVGALKHILRRPELADLVIPDLAQWEDWTVADQLFELFKTADQKTTWVRVPVINYLRKCPLAHAKELLKECEKLDPQAVKRAHAFFPDGLPADPKKAS